MQPFRVLVVGHGLIGSQRAAATRRLEESLGVRLAATVDPEDRAADLYGDVPHHAGFGDVDPDAYDAAVVALPHDLAVETAAAIIAAGKPVLIEKPLGTTGAAARELETAADALELPSFVGYNYRFLPHVRELFAAVAAGELGALRSVEMLIGHGGNPGSAEGWKLRPERAGGGVILDPGVHLLDLLLLLDPEIDASCALGTTGFWGTGIEEDAAAVFRDGPLLATVRVSHVRWRNTLRIEVFGDDGYALLGGRGGTYGPMTSAIGRRWAWRDDPQDRPQAETERRSDHGAENRSLDDELEAVLRRWLGEQDASVPGPATMAEGRRVTELAEQLYSMLTL
jgi:1,5-anhydro-D-fructose reductase (1,5-anhydro-D-mannitol-forming)